MMPILPNATKYPLEFSRRPCTWLAIPLISGILVGEYTGELKILAFYILLTVITLALARLPRRFISEHGNPVLWTGSEKKATP